MKPDLNYCNDCENLSITEKEQHEAKITACHMCCLLGRRIYHMDCHPWLPRPKDCPTRKKGNGNG